MSKEIGNSIHELLDLSMRFNRNDVLVDMAASTNKWIDAEHGMQYERDSFPRQIIKESERIVRESGINPLCLTNGIMHWKLRDELWETPILLTPLNKSVDKVNGKLTFLPVQEEQFVNPFLLQQLQRKFDRVVDLSTLDTQESVFDQLATFGFKIDRETRRIGNFHHHRYHVVKELEELTQKTTFSKSIGAIFGFEQNDHLLTLSDTNLFPADADQEMAFQLAKTTDIVVQGPPGTGKSQSLTNLIAKCLVEEHPVLVVSEKRVALEVIVKKLAQFGLDKLGFIATSDRIGESFISSLKETYLFVESYRENKENILKSAAQYESSLQLTFEILSQPELLGGISLYEFLKDYPKADGVIPSFESDIPDLKDFRANEALIRTIYDRGINETLGYLRKTVIDLELHQLDIGLNQIEQSFKLNEDFNVKTWKDLQDAMRLAAKCQVFSNDLYKKYAKLFVPDSPERKRFEKLSARYKKLLIKQEQFLEFNPFYPNDFSVKELRILREKLGAMHGFFGRMRANRLWLKVADLPYDLALETIDRMIEKKELEQEIAKIKIEFCDLNIEQPELSLVLITQVLHQYSKEEWNFLFNLSVAEREKYNSGHHRLRTLYDRLSGIFNLEDGMILTDLVAKSKTSLAHLIVLKSELEKLDPVTLRCLRGKDNFDLYKATVVESYRVRFQERYPHFSKFSIREIKERVDALIDAQDKDAVLFAREIMRNVKKRFDEYHALLNTPASKLPADRKELKQKLRKGKAVLVREFAKSRSHRSLRELFHSEAWLWIQLLKPVWLSNPAQLAKSFPLDQSLFDVVIFDESSQIPFQNALGAIERSRRVIVVGDEQQMGPSDYFNSGSSDQMSLLQAAMYYLKSSSLNHHYRSLHPDLIAFSNRHFYQGKLITYPTYKAESPIALHYLPEGRYLNRINLAEAEAIALRLSKLLQGDESFGVVAFSEEQLNAIYKMLSPFDQNVLEERLQSPNCFFKSLENVQGDECDHLLISFGYGKDEQEKFAMRFGPMNTDNGRRRLNVLLTRASRKIDFYCSVKAEDFKLSSNESLNLIRLWFLFLENYSEDRSITIPFNLPYTRVENQITIDQVHRCNEHLREVVTFQRIMEQRGWKIAYR